MQALSKDEIVTLLSAAKAASERDWLMILFAYSHGARATEVVTLTASCIEDGFVTLKRLKGSNTTVQPLMSSENPLLDERTALPEFIRGMHAEQKVFSVARSTFWRAMQRHGRTAGIPAHKLFPHVLKHSCAMHSIKAAGIENVRVWLGHKSISSTGEYLKVNDETAAAAISAAMRSV